MKKYTGVLALAILGFTAQVQADTVFGLYAGADFWPGKVVGGFANSEQIQDFALKDSSNTAYYLAIEHFVPVLPNIRIQHVALETQGQTLLNTSFNFAGRSFAAGSTVQARLDLTSTDYILYYELLDNALLAVDLGVNAKHLKGDVSVINANVRGSEHLNAWLPMLYLDSKIGIVPGEFDVFASGSAAHYNGNHLYDIQAGLGYQLLTNPLLNARVKLGYRLMDLRLDDVNNLYADLKFKGIFAGLEVHF